MACWWGLTPLYAIDDATKCASEYKYHKLSHVDDPLLLLLRHGLDRSDVRFLSFPNPLRAGRRLLRHLLRRLEFELLDAKKGDRARLVE